MFPHFDRPLTCTDVVFAATGHSPFEAGDIPAVFHRVLNDDPDLSVFEGPLRDCRS